MVESALKEIAVAIELGNRQPYRLQSRIQALSNAISLLLVLAQEDRVQAVEIVTNQ